MTAPADEAAPPTVTVVQAPSGWNVVEDGRVVSRHRKREPAHKAALDWAGGQFEQGRRLVVILG